MRRTVAVNELGIRVGEDHQRAKLTNAEVEQVRKLHATGMSYRQISEKFEISKFTVGRICRFERRAQSVAGHKVVHIADAEQGGIEA